MTQRLLLALPLLLACSSPQVRQPEPHARPCSEINTAQAQPLALVASERRGGFDSTQAACESAAVIDLGLDLATLEGPLGCSFDAVTLAPNTRVGVLLTQSDDLPGNSIAHIALEREGAFFLYQTLASTYNPGAFGIFEDLTLESPVLEGNRVTLRYSHARGDSDMGTNEIETVAHELLKVCLWTGDDLRCFPTWAQHFHYERTLLHEEEEEPGTPHPDLRTVTVTHALQICGDVLISEEIERTGDAQDTPALGQILPPGVYRLTQ